MKRRLQFTLGAIFFAFLLIYGGERFYRSFALLGMESEPGWLARQAGTQVRVDRLRNPEPAGLLRPGDEVLTLNGQAIKSASEVARIFQHIDPDTSYTMLIRRSGVISEVTLNSRPIPLLQFVVNGAASLVIPNIFLLTGLIVFMLRPDDKQALLLALMFGMFNGASLAFDPAYSGEPVVMVAIMLTVHLVSPFLLPVFFHFFLIFPEPSPLVRRVPKLEAYLYLPQLLIIFPYLALQSIMQAFGADPNAFRYPALARITFIVAVAYVVAGLLSLLINYQQAGRKSKRKMRVVVAGSIAGFLPTFLLIGLAILFNLPRNHPVIQWLGIVALFSFPLFPLSFAYAIVRHQVIPVRLILRRSVRYLFVSRGFIIIQAAVVFTVLSFLLTGRRLAAIDDLGERADIVVTMAATALAIAGLTFLNQRVMPIIDRRFFRESYDAQQVLSELGIEMRKVSTVEQLLERAVDKIQNALHVENVTIFLLDREHNEYVCAISSRLTDDRVTTTHQDPDLVLSPDGALVQRMSRFTNPVPVDFARYSPWTQSVLSTELAMNDQRRQENATLGRVRAALLLPVATKDELLAIVSLGPRLGDLPFSRDDRHLLMAVAMQMALAIQNAELVQEIAIEERLRHELAIATTVQQRLFPENPPEMASLDLAGVCHPARGVGGDYYDFIVLDGGKVGIAVADVAGKGISAALLMCTVQASLRSQAQAVNGNLTELVSSMNHLLHVSTDASAYATFFYAQFEERSGLLTYVNAGHNPPMLVRAGANVKARGAGYAGGAHDGLMVAGDSRARAEETEVTLLTKGGPIIGAFSGCVYEQETLQMESGDLLVAYTDGVTEARDSYDQEFGEARLRSIIGASADIPAQELSERIVQSVREWCGEVPPHDDLTLVVMKVR